MSFPSSALYFGKVFHARVRPKRHQLTYRVFSSLLYLDELPKLAKTSKLFSLNRFNLISFYEKDHGAGEDTGLDAWVRQQLRDAGIDLGSGRISLLCYPRMLGYVFNPLGVFFCYTETGQLGAILYQVSNTFGERHSYLFDVRGENEETLHHACEKEFYVSPFNAVEGHYQFKIVPPSDKTEVVIHQHDEEGLVLTASFAGERKPFSALGQALLRYPLMTVKVIVGIHWEAFRLWRKGLGLQPRPPLPESAISNKPIDVSKPKSTPSGNSA
jgi:DUF1365 family protein